MAAFSLDLRRRILDTALAERFQISRSFVQKLKCHWRTHGTVEPVGHRGGTSPKLSPTTGPRYEIILYWSAGDETFIAEGPELPGCVAEGRNYEEAVHNAETVLQE